MNSVDKHINAEGKAATLLAMRSARKEVLFVVEGDTDVDLFAHTLGIPRSNILSCNGKETLMLVFAMAPQKGIDAGSVFIRDRDNDAVSTSACNGVIILVTQKYDVEMELLENRIFGRILSEFLKDPLPSAKVTTDFEKICQASSCIGAIRIHSQENDINLKFDDLKYTKFFNPRDLSVNISEAVRYIFAKSEKVLTDKFAVEKAVGALMSGRAPVDIVCSKEFLEIFHLALSRYYKACSSAECAPITLGRAVRIAATHDDIKNLSLYQPLKAHINSCGYAWIGNSL